MLELISYILQAQRAISAVADTDHCHRFHQLHSVSLNMHLTVAKSSNYFMRAHRRDTVLAQVLERAPYAALHSRVQVHVQLKPVLERERFALLIAHALKGAGSQHNLLADTGLEILRQASKGLPRQAGRILCTAMRLAVPKGLNHLPDEILQQAIKELQ